MRQLRLAYILPLLAMATVGFVMTGLGGLFSAVGTTGTIILGLALVVFIPLIGHRLTSNSSGSSNGLQIISIRLIKKRLILGQLYWVVDALVFIWFDAWHIG